jgi:hypothetical protein
MKERCTLKEIRQKNTTELSACLRVRRVNPVRFVFMLIGGIIFSPAFGYFHGTKLNMTYNNVTA